MNPILEDELKDIVYLIDRSLKYCKDLRVDFSTPEFFTLNVKDIIGKPRVLKGCKRWHPTFPKSIIKEKMALFKLKGIKGITQIIDQYKGARSIAMLKEFAHGSSPYDGISNDTAREKLRDTLKQIHKRGVADIDIKPSNIKVFGPYAKIIDMNFYSLKSNQSNISWKNHCEEDLKNLEKVFRGEFNY